MAVDKAKILADADIGATYVLALIERGVPVSAAIGMASSYIFACRASEEPREPWERT